MVSGRVTILPAQLSMNNNLCRDSIDNKKKQMNLHAAWKLLKSSPNATT